MTDISWHLYRQQWQKPTGNNRPASLPVAEDWNTGHFGWHGHAVVLET